jgi:hypothetical protein
VHPTRALNIEETNQKVHSGPRPRPYPPRSHGGAPAADRRSRGLATVWVPARCQPTRPPRDGPSRTVLAGWRLPAGVWPRTRVRAPLRGDLAHRCADARPLPADPPWLNTSPPPPSCLRNPSVEETTFVPSAQPFPFFLLSRSPSLNPPSAVPDPTIAQIVKGPLWCDPSWVAGSDSSHKSLPLTDANLARHLEVSDARAHGAAPPRPAPTSSSLLRPPLQPHLPPPVLQAARRRRQGTRRARRAAAPRRGSPRAALRASTATASVAAPGPRTARTVPGASARRQQRAPHGRLARSRSLATRSPRSLSRTRVRSPSRAH